MQHTPGPWKADGGAGVVACTESEILSSGRRVSRRVACAKGLTKEEAGANAHLIAAAPDLLAALVAMVDAYRDGYGDEDQPSMVKQALAAIAKASPAGAAARWRTR